jgi:hypothetical protein
MILLSDMIRQAMAHPGAVNRYDGNGQVVQSIPTPPASIRVFKLDDAATPVADSVRSFLPSGTAVGKQTALSASILQKSLVAQAGARIIVVPAPSQSLAGTGGVTMVQRPAAFVVVEGGQFASVADGQEAPVSEIPLKRVELSHDVPAVGICFELTRRQMKDLSDDVTTDAIWSAIAIGLANEADRVLLTALNSAVLDDFSLGQVAARGLRWGELSAVIGTDASVTTTVENGVLRTSGIAAELTNAIPSTILGAFNRAAVAIGEDLTVTALRTKNGACQITAFVNMEAVVADTTAFWKAA